MKEVYVLGDHPTISNRLLAPVCDAHILTTSF